jgi:chitinase
MMNLLSLVALASRPSVDVIGYYGNSGSAVSAIPLLADIHPNYNVLILTFATITETGAVTLDLQGPYAKDHARLAADVKAWRQVRDKWGRERRVLVSIGGQNGRWPTSLPGAVLQKSLDVFIDGLGLDGLDIDLEGQTVSAATSLIPVVSNLTRSGKVVTAAPEAAQFSLDAYKKLLPSLTWVHPQFYNNGPNAVAAPYVPPASLWPTPWTVHNWQAESRNQSFWAGVLRAVGTATGLEAPQLGMLIPATPAAASSYNQWDIALLAEQVMRANVLHVGCWAVAYDHTQNWRFAEAIGALNHAEAPLVEWTQSHEARGPPVVRDACFPKPTAPWCNTSMPFATRATLLVAALTLDEKIQQLSTFTPKTVPGVSRVGLPPFSYHSACASEDPNASPRAAPQISRRSSMFATRR